MACTAPSSPTVILTPSPPCAVTATPTAVPSAVTWVLRHLPRGHEATAVGVEVAPPSPPVEPQAAPPSMRMAKAAIRLSRDLVMVLPRFVFLADVMPTAHRVRRAIEVKMWLEKSHRYVPRHIRDTWLSAGGVAVSYRRRESVRASGS